jgi:hypothetical protein
MGRGVLCLQSLSLLGVFHHKVAPGELLSGNHIPSFTIYEVNLHDFFLAAFSQLIYFCPFFKLQLSFALPGAPSNSVEIREFAMLFPLNFFPRGLSAFEVFFGACLVTAALVESHDEDGVLEILLLRISGLEKMSGDLSWYL